MNSKLLLLIGILAASSTTRAANYYVNDVSTNGDVFCSAPGALINSGTNSNVPKPSLGDILATYALTPGDTVFIDTGNYTNSTTPVIGSTDSGSQLGGVVTVKGAGNTKVFIYGGSGYGIHCLNAGYVRLDGLAFRGGAQGVRVEDSLHIEVLNCDVGSAGNGIIISGGSDNRVQSCVVHDNGDRGVVGSSSPTLVLTGNRIFNHLNGAGPRHGIDLSYNCNAAQITANIITNNLGQGIRLYSCAAPVLQDNLVANHGQEGIYLQSCSSASVVNHTIYLNAGGVHGYYSPSLTLTGNRIYSNNGYGVYAEGGAITGSGNLIYTNIGPGLTLLNSPQSTVENNTFYRNTTVNLRLAGTHNNIRVANNILSSSGAAQTCIQFDTIGTSWLADYNDYFITNSAVMWNWKGPRYSLAALQNYSGMERHSIDLDPLFLDPDGTDNQLGGNFGMDDNFHLAANSPALDAGDPDSNFSSEPAPNGSRINLGHLGGTAQADTSGSQRLLRLLAPNGGEILFRRGVVRWAATGPWATNDMVTIEFSANNGGSWTTAASAGVLNSANGFYGWDVSGLAPGVSYLIRVTYLSQPAITDTSDAMFEIQGPGAKTIYLNDGSTVNDTWCSAAGARTNSGLTAASPLDAFQSVIEKYPAIGAGDEIRVDTGVFDLGRTVYLNQQNSGSSGSPLVIRGSTSGAAIFNRLDQADDTFLFDSVSYVRFERLNFTLGAAGLRVAGTSLNPSVGITITDCQSYSNSSYGMIVSTCTTLLVKNCTSIRNGSDGYSLSASDSIVTNNFAGWNSGSGLGFGGYGVVSLNLCASNSVTGLGASRNDQMTLVVSSNQIHHNGGTGLWIGGGTYGGDAQAIGNTVYANGGNGLVGRSCYGLIGNLVSSNSGDGIVSEYATHITKNISSDNKGHGINGWFGMIVTNNLMIRNGASVSYYNLVLPRDAVGKNNTLVGSNGIVVTDAGGVQIANNIICTRGAGMTAIYVQNPPGSMTSDYNDIYLTDGAVAGNWLGPRTTLDSWQQVSLRDTHSIAVEPRFVDNATNFHLRSTAGSYRGAPFSAPSGGLFVADSDLSFCVDGGDPAASFAQEPAPNGGRMDLGAFGNTPDASLTPASRFSLLVEPLPGAKWFGTRSILWLTRGPWVGGDLIKLEFSADGGVNWSNIVASANYSLGRYDWNTTGLPPGTNYLVRVSKTDGSAMDVADAAFEVSASGPRTYYVNDTNTANDVFCLVAGSAANDGLSTATPKDSVQAILDTYVVNGGDTIKIDTGNYLLTATIVMTTNDVGAAGNPIVIQGSTNGTILNRQNTSYDTFYLQGAEYVRFLNLKFTGGRFGLSGDGTTANYLRGVEILNCETMSNGTHGFNFSYTSNLVISACSLHHNGNRGASLGAAVQVTIVSNVTSFNSEGVWVDATGTITGNQCFSNSSRGLGMSGTFLVSGNTVWANGVGIQGWSNLKVVNNLCYSNAYEGIDLRLGAIHEIESNRVFGNVRTGIYFEGSGYARRNVVYSNGDHGIQIEGWEGDYREVVNNLCYLNGNAPGEFNIVGGANYWQAKRGLIENNTCYGGSGIYIGNPIAFTNRHNIIWATGSNSVALVRYTHMDRYPGGILQSDNNLIYTTDNAIAGQWNGNQAELADWQYATKQDYHSFVANPQFVNPAGADGIIGGNNGGDDNFHLASAAGSFKGTPFSATAISSFTSDATTSSGIDAAIPSSSLGDEIAPNGSRRNLGAFGGTFDASLSPGVPGISILNLATSDNLRGVKTLYWITRGPWTNGETMRLEWSTNGGANWFPVAGANALPYNQTSYDWDTSSLTPGANYTVHLVANTSGASQQISSIRILANGPTDFYVNDTSPTNDVYCTALGDESNSGLAPSAPKATLKRLFRDYRLLGGDRVWIDTGFWRLDSTLQFFDSGTVAAKIRFIGSTNGVGSKFDRGDNQQNGFLLNLVDNISLETLKIVNSYNAIHIEGSGSDLCDGVQVLGCELMTNSLRSVYFTSATNLVIANCDIHDNVGSGIFGGGYGIIRSNRVYRTTGDDAIRAWGGPLFVEGNQVFQNRYRGIDGVTLVTCRGNTVYSNGTDGIYLEGNSANPCEAIENRVFLNDAQGLYLQYSSSARRNVVYSNKGHGIYVEGFEGDFRVIANNLAYNNGNTADAFNICLGANYWQGKRALIENNTVYGGGGIYIGNPIAVTNRNNIIWATGGNRYALVRYTHMDRYAWGSWESDNNCIRTTDGAIFSSWLGRQNDLLEWRAATGQDAHSFVADPLFVNPAGTDGLLGGTNGLDDNFHLASTMGSYKGFPFTALTTAGFTADASHSLCIDAGLSTSAIGAESAPNGGRIDLGAFGGTADASLSTAALVVELGNIGGGSVLRGTVPIYWWTHGPWQSNDTVIIEYSNNGGGSWTTIPGATALPFAQGVFAWDTSGLTPGTNFKVRITPNTGGVPAMSGLLVILPNSGAVFYLNDSSSTNDVYCTTIGSDANDGLSPSTPMANLKRLVVTYKLMPGDTIRIDTGLWTLDANLMLTESGAPGQLIRLVGSTNAMGSVFNRNDTGVGMYGLHLKGNHYVRLENLKVTGAEHGITGGGSQGIEIVGCEVYGNTVWGIAVGSCTNIVVSGCIARNNGHGLDVDGGTGTVSGNSVHHNNGWGLYLNGNFLADGNDCYNNSSSALYGQNGVRAYNNLIHENTGEPALRLAGVGCEAAMNRVYMNSGDGMNVNSSGITRRNVVYSNGGHGMTVDSWYGANTVINNLVYDNDRSNEGHWNMFVSRNGDIIQNNTIYGGNGLYWNGPWGDVTRHNIIWARGSGHYAIYYANSSVTPVSDYNNFYATEGATLGYWAGTARTNLAEWKTITGLDTNSLSTDPLFVDVNGSDDTLGGFYGADDDFHLASTAGSYHTGYWSADATNSPCIDAGDPSMVFTNEPYYNGLRINLGAFGNTPEASKTAYSGTFYALNITLNPTNGGTVSTWPPGVSNLYFPAGAAVTATATNTLGFIWGSWSGAIASTNISVPLVVNSNTAITANFIPVMPHVLYRLEDSLAASIGTPPDLTNIGTGLNFSTLTVRGAARRVLNFPYNTGLQLQPTFGVFPNEFYSIAMLVKLDAVNGWRRLLDLRNGVDQGLYVHDGKLEFFPYGASAVCMTNGTWHMVVLTHDASGQMKMYCDGVLQLTVTDSSNYGVVSSANTLRFCKDDGGDIGSGSVSRIHIFSRVLTPTEVADLNALDDANPLITSPNLTGAAQGVPFLWPVTGPGIATNLASGLPPGLSMDSTSALISGTPTTAGVFDAFITSTNGYGVATQTLRIVVSSSANLLFREDFNNGLSANWNALSVDSNYFAFQPAMMDVRANNGETYTYYNRTLNLFAFSNLYAGNMMITLGVTRYEPTAANYNRLCLAVWDDYDNNIRFAYGYGNGRGLDLLAEQAQTVSGAGLALDFTNQPFLLRLIKQGGGANDLYTAYYSTNGVDFLAYTNNTVSNGSGKPMKLGFWFGDDPYENTHALIDYFEVAALPPTPNTQTYADNFTAGNGATSWRLQNNANLYTFDQSQGALVMSKTSGGSGAGTEWAYAYSAVTANGDFEARVDYHDAMLTRLGGGWGNQIQLNVAYGGQAFVVVRGDEGGLGGNNAHVWDSQSGNQGTVATSETNGTLRIIRTGTIMKGYHNDTFLWQRTCNTNAATIYLSLQNNGTADPISVKFDNFYVSAQQATLGTPAFTSPSLTGGILSSPFVWLLTADYASGFTASGLPPGLSITSGGLITGTPTTFGTYNATVTATNASSSTNQTLRIVVRFPGSLLYRDDFSAGYATNWITVPPSNYLSAVPGTLRVRANNGDTSGSTVPAPFSITAPTNGVFAFTLALSKFTPGNWNSPSVWLMAWEDYDHYVRFGTYGGTGGSRAQFLMETNAGVNFYTDYSTNFGPGPFLLRLNVSNNVYTSAYSTNGVDFLPLPGTYSPTTFTPTKVGFWVGIDPNQSEVALVDYFEVSAVPPDPVAPWLSTFSLTGTNADLNADSDKDGLKNIFEYAFNQNPTNASSGIFPAASLASDYIVLTYRQRIGGTGAVGVNYTANGLTYLVQMTDDLAGTWQSGPAFVELVPGGRVDNGDGTETVSVRFKQFVTGTAPKFMRLILVPTTP
jgi:parallel beta-helix repeat protein